MVHLERTADLITKSLTNNYDLSSEVELKEDRVIITANVLLADVNDADVMIKVLVYDSGSAFITFVFNKIDDNKIKDDENLIKFLLILNKINKEALFKAYVNQDDYVCLELCFYNVSEADNVLSNLEYAINDMLTSDMSELLNDLIKYLE